MRMKLCNTFRLMADKIIEFAKRIADLPAGAEQLAELSAVMGKSSTLTGVRPSLERILAPFLRFGAACSRIPEAFGARSRFPFLERFLATKMDYTLRKRIRKQESRSTEGLIGEC